MTKSLTTLYDCVRMCNKCEISKSRTQIVFGDGNPNSKLVFIGEAPGKDEDAQGIPFVGMSGKLLRALLHTVGIEDFYICNILKCRPPENRNPHPNEIRNCKPFLFEQLSYIKPKVMATLGTFSSQTILGVSTPISHMVGMIYEYNNFDVMPLYHPAHILRNRGLIPLMKDHLLQIKQRMDLS